MTASTDLDSLLVSFRCGTVCYVLLMNEDGSTSELRGVPMWRWLDEFAHHLKVFPKKAASSKPTSWQLDLLLEPGQVRTPDGKPTQARTQPAI